MKTITIRIDGGDDSDNVIWSGFKDQWPHLPLAGGLRGAALDGPNNGTVPDGAGPNGTSTNDAEPSVEGAILFAVLVLVLLIVLLALLAVALCRCKRETEGGFHLTVPLLRPGSSRLERGKSFRLSVPRNAGGVGVWVEPTPEDRSARLARATSAFDPNGRGVGSSPAAAGSGRSRSVEVWRVRGRDIAPCPEGKRGRFRRGDAYIVLCTTTEEDPNAKYDGGGGGGLRWDVHFWIGRRCSAMRSGVAAARAVELDDLLGGDPVQHRQVEGIETDAFLGLFPGGVCCLDGTADDGLGDEGRLYRMVREGRRRRYSEVPLARSSLNEGDAFLLDAGTRVYTWYGARASRFGRVARAALEELMDGRKGNIQYFMDVGDDNDEFFELLGGRGEIAPAAEGAAAAVDSDEDEQEKHMYVVSDAEGYIDVHEVPWSRSSLVSDDVFIVDCGEDLYVWVGKGSTTAEREQSMLISHSFLKELGRTETTRIHRVKEGQEGKLEQFLAEFE